MMKPITDEIVHSLIEGAERRQNRADAVNDPVPLLRTSEMARRGMRFISLEPVSYTHLTLPTIYSV